MLTTHKVDAYRIIFSTATAWAVDTNPKLNDNDSSAPSVDSAMRVPVELVVIIAEFLLGDSCFASVASLNVTSKLVQAETAAALYATMILSLPQLESLQAEIDESWVSGQALKGGSRLELVK
jgi:hypothetical protein